MGGKGEGATRYIVIFYSSCNMCNMCLDGLLECCFWLRITDIIWKLVPGHRTDQWKGSLMKCFCFDGEIVLVFRSRIWQRTVTEGGYFVLNFSCHWKPVEWVQNGSDVVWLGSFDCESCSCILDLMKYVQKVKQGITAVLSGKYEGWNECFCGMNS